MDRLADGVVAAERERDVADAAGDARAGQLRLDASHGLDVGHGVAGVLLDARADGEHVRIEDDVVRREADLFGQQLVGAPGRSRACAPPMSAWPSSSKAMTMTAAP